MSSFLIGRCTSTFLIWQVHDLLGRGRNLRVRESASRGVHVPDATQRVVEWEQDVMRALVTDNYNIATATATTTTIATTTTTTDNNNDACATGDWATKPRRRRC